MPPADTITDAEASDAHAARKRLLEAVEKHLKVKAAGFAGVTSEGTIVDRRDHPDAIPMQRNNHLSIPAPTMCYRIQCGSPRLAWLDKAAGDVECLECGKLQPTIG